MKTPSFRAQLTDALREAILSLREVVGKEHLCTVALHTSGESEFDYVCASAEKRDAKVYGDFLKSLATLDGEGLFGTGAARRRVTLAVMCGDMSAEFLSKGIKKLNPPEVVQRYVDANTPARLYARLESLPMAERAKAYLALYLDLSLDRDSPDAAIARRVGLDHASRLGKKLASLGGVIVEDLVSVVEAYAYGPVFNARDSEAWRRHGAFTCEASLASGAAFLLAEVGGLSDSHIVRLQSVIGKRHAQDATAEGPVSVLPENIARVLHGLLPDRFPATVKDPKTNRLLNVDAYRHSE